MGCWNETCGISHLPITGTSKVVEIILIENNKHTFSRGSCEVMDRFTPLFLPIYGESDDYGGLEKIEKNIITEKLVEIISTENPKKEITCIEDINENIEKLKFKDRNLGRMYILREIYNRLTEGIISEYSRDVNIYLDECLKFPTDPFDIEFNFAQTRLVSCLSSMRYFRLHPYMLKLKDDERLEAIGEYVRLLILEGFMTKTRRMFIPQCGIGSQEEEYEEHLKLAKIVTGICNRKIKEQKD